MEGVPQHFPADEGQKHEGDPMIHRRDELLELRAQRPSDKRHERLEAAEEQRDDRRLAQVEPLHAQAFAYRHGCLLYTSRCV